MPSPAASHVVLESCLSCIMLGLVMYPCAEPGLAVQTSEFMHLFNYTAVYNVWRGGACPVLLWMVCLRTVSFLMFSLRLFEDREGAELCCIILLPRAVCSPDWGMVPPELSLKPASPVGFSKALMFYWEQSILRPSHLLMGKGILVKIQVIFCNAR